MLTSSSCKRTGLHTLCLLSTILRHILFTFMLQSAGVCITQVVEGMRHGLSPRAAAEAAVRRMVRKYRTYVGALLAVDRTGRHAAACHGWTFTYAVRSAGMNATRVYTVESLKDTLDDSTVPDGPQMTA
jgi:hypothetical protein